MRPWRGGLDNYAPEPNTGCFLWLGGVTNGYGIVTLAGRMVRAHRAMYEREIGPIPAGLTLDHLCRQRSCVNPAHLEPVTLRENILRGCSPSAAHARRIHCPRGHPYSPENTMRWRNERRCRACISDRSHRYEEANPHRKHGAA